MGAEPPVYMSRLQHFDTLPQASSDKTCVGRVRGIRLLSGVVGLSP
jgi:hypothetical protein